MNIKVGDTVITNRFESYKDGAPRFDTEMKEFCGVKGKVTGAWANSLVVHGWNWPISACTKVEPETTLKPFNLEQALAGKKVVTRSGKEVTHIIHMKDSPNRQKVVAIVEFSALQFGDDGSFLLQGMDKGESDYDLFMAPEIVTRWVNVYEDSGYDSEDIARTIGEAARNYLGTFKIEIPC